MVINIRKAELKDAPGIAYVHVKTWQCAYRGQVPDSYLDNLSVEKQAEKWVKNIEHPDNNAQIFVAEDTGKVVGWFSAGKCRDNDANEKTGELWAIYVHPDYMGIGVGSQLMEKALGVLKEEGYERATLWVLDTNEKTRKWYEVKGWRLGEETKVDHREGFDLNEVRYKLEL